MSTKQNVRNYMVGMTIYEAAGYLQSLIQVKSFSEAKYANEFLAELIEEEGKLGLRTQQCVIACRRDGKAVLLHVVVKAPQKEIDRGYHLQAAQLYAEHAEGEGPFVVFDQDSPPMAQGCLANMFSWNEADVVSLPSRKTNPLTS